MQQSKSVDEQLNTGATQAGKNKQSKNFYEKCNSILKSIALQTKQIYKKASPKLGDAYNKTKQFSKVVFSKTKQLSQKSYQKGKQYTGSALNKTKQGSKQALQTTKYYSSVIYTNTKQLVKEATKQGQKILRNPETYHKIVKYLSSKEITKQNIQNIFGQSIINFFVGLGLSKPLLGLILNNLSFIKGTLLSSKIFSFGMLNLKALTLKSLLLTYAPVIIPTVIVTYGGYQIYMDVAKKKRPSSQPEKTENEQVQGQQQQQLKFNEKIQKIQTNYVNQVDVQSLKDWMKKYQKIDKNTQKTF